MTKLEKKRMETDQVAKVRAVKTALLGWASGPIAERIWKAKDESAGRRILLAGLARLFAGLARTPSAAQTRRDIAKLKAVAAKARRWARAHGYQRRGQGKKSCM